MAHGACLSQWITHASKLNRTLTKCIDVFQMKAVPAGLDNLALVDDDTRKETFKLGSQGGGGVEGTGRKWKTGELEFEALMRQLDNAVSSS